MQMKKAYEHSHYRFSRSSRLSPRNGLTAYFVISPVERACCHRRPRDTSRELNASIAASEPHDLAVRPGDFVRREITPDAKSVHRIPCPTFVTIAKRPFCGRETASVI